MKDLLSSVVANKFLESFEENAEIIILEEAQESKKLLNIAKARGINLRKNRDLSGFKAIYAFADKANQNKQILPEKALLKALPTIIGKPVNLRHERRFVVGHLLDYAYQQKEKRVIVYGVFYKSCFDKEWEEAKKDFKSGKLHVSFEIWNAASKRKYLPDGTYLMLEQEMAGMAILPRDTEPAFKGAKVLEFARKKMEKEKDLVYASKYKDKEIIVANQNHFKTEVEQNYQKMLEEQNKLPIIKCSNCEKEFESLEKINIKCPNCFAIVDKAGGMLYPPQIKNFKMQCPACRVDNWLIISNKEDTAKLKCQSCAKEYQVKFAKEEKSEMLDKMTFLYIGHATCPQCGRRISVEGSSKMETVPLTCDRCKLRFIFNRAKMEKYKQISEIDEIVEKPKEEPEKDKKSSKEGGEEEMEIPKEIEEKVKKEEKKNEELKEKPSSEEKVEPKSEKTEEVVEEKKPEKSQAEPEKAQKETIEKVEEPKAEETKEEITKKEKIETIKETKEKIEPVKATKESKEETTEKDKIETTKETKEVTEKPKEEVTKKEELVVEKTKEEKAEETPKVETTENKEAPIEVTVEKPEEAQKTKQQQRGKVVFPHESPKVKDNKDHFPINDANQARNALARVAQYSSVPTWYDGTLAEVQTKVRNAVAKAYPSIKVTKSTKALRRAVNKIKELEKLLKESKEKKETLVSAVKKTATQVISLKEEIAKINKESEEKIKLYKENAQTVVMRKAELGEEYSKELSDEDILNEDKFERVKLQKENDLLKGSKDKETDVVGEKPKAQDEEIARQRKDIDDKAFGRKKRNA